MERGPQPADRCPLGQCRRRSKARSRIGRSRTRRPRCCDRHRIPGTVAAGDENYSDRGAGFVASLAKPGGNATGFTAYEFSMSGKWLELLKEIAPSVTRAAVLRDPAVASGIGQFGAFQIVAPSFGVELIPVDVRDAGEIERAVAAFASGSNGGLIMTASALGTSHRELITTMAARHKLPAVYPSRPYVTAGGLISYGPDLLDQFQRAAGYVDRILKGEKPADLPVQQPASGGPYPRATAPYPECEH